MTSLLPRLYDLSILRFFGDLIFLCQQLTFTKQFEEKICLIIGFDVNMTPERALLQKVMRLLILTENKTVLRQ